LQLQKVGKAIRPGQRVRFFYMRGEPGVHAWDLPNLPNPAALDIARYRTLLVRAAGTILQPMGVDEDLLLAWVNNSPVDIALLPATFSLK
jgi:hypothetical protein